MKGMILTSEQLFAAVRDTTEALRAAGRHENALEIEKALSISSIGSEVLGETRRALNAVDCAGLGDELRYRISAQLTFIDSVLGTSFR